MPQRLLANAQESRQSHANGVFWAGMCWFPCARGCAAYGCFCGSVGEEDRLIFLRKNRFIFLRNGIDTIPDGSLHGAINLTGGPCLFCQRRILPLLGAGIPCRLVFIPLRRDVGRGRYLRNTNYFRALTCSPLLNSSHHRPRPTG
jgi:hypothetical protein